MGVRLRTAVIKLSLKTDAREHNKCTIFNLCVRGPNHRVATFCKLFFCFYGHLCGDYFVVVVFVLLFLFFENRSRHFG